MKLAPRRDYGNNKKSPSSCANARLPENVPILGLGCSSFSTFFLSEEELRQVIPPVEDWNNPPRDHPLVQQWVETIIHAVLDCGINLLDTAPWYGHGSSEIVIGYAMEKLLNSHPTSIERSQIIINTKVGRYEGSPDKMFDYSAKRVLESVQTSLMRMKCGGYIDVLQLHDPEYSPSMDLLVDVTIPEMAKLRDQGFVKAIGMTGYPLEVQWELMERSRKEHNILFDQCLTYCHYNLHDQSLFTPKFPSENGYKISFESYCDKHNIGLTVAAPLSMGLLTQKGPPAWHPASLDLKEACCNAVKLCNENSLDISELALLFAFGQERIPCTILGMKNVNEVDRAMTIACRFHNRAYDRSTPSIDQVLSPKEKYVLAKLLNQDIGPFSAVFKSGNFQWDGMECAKQFWAEIPGGKEPASTRMLLKKKMTL